MKTEHKLETPCGFDGVAVQLTSYLIRSENGSAEAAATQLDICDLGGGLKTHVEFMLSLEIDDMVGLRDAINKHIRHRRIIEKTKVGAGRTATLGPNV